MMADTKTLLPLLLQEPLLSYAEIADKVGASLMQIMNAQRYGRVGLGLPIKGVRDGRPRSKGLTFPKRADPKDGTASKRALDLLRDPAGYSYRRIAVTVRAEFGTKCSKEDLRYLKATCKGPFPKKRQRSNWRTGNIGP